MAKKYRIEVSPELHKALRIMAAKEDMTVKDFTIKTLSAAVDLKTWDYIEEETKDPRTIPPPDDRPKLADNLEALEEIKRLWIAGERSPAAIARRIGYPRTTTGERIKAMQESGELVI
jgi:hypothetical protein